MDSPFDNKDTGIQRVGGTNPAELGPSITNAKRIARSGARPRVLSGNAPPQIKVGQVKKLSKTDAQPPA